MTADEAAAAIKEKVLLFNSELTDTLLTFYVEKLVADILAYCHREDFPDALVYSCVELVLKRGADEVGGSQGPLSSVKMDDTEFRFAVTSVDTAGIAADRDFNTLRPRLNLYRKVKWP